MNDAENLVRAHFAFPKEHAPQLHTSNPLERFNGEIRRQARAGKRVRLMTGQPHHGPVHDRQPSSQGSVNLKLLPLRNGIRISSIKVRAAHGNSVAVPLGGVQPRDQMGSLAHLETRPFEVATERFRGATQMLGEERFGNGVEGQVVGRPHA